MTNPEPEQKTKIIIEILVRNKIPAIINIASGGLVKPDSFDSELIHFVPRIQYDLIFKKYTQSFIMAVQEQLIWHLRTDVQQ